MRLTPSRLWISPRDGDPTRHRARRDGGATLALRAIDDTRLVHIEPIDLAGDSDAHVLSSMPGWTADGGDAQTVDGMPYHANSVGVVRLLIALGLEPNVVLS